MRNGVLAVLSSGLLALGCHSITEELPTRPTTTGGGNLPPTVNVPVPVTVTPVDLPNPNPQPAPAPASGGDPTGGGGDVPEGGGTDSDPFIPDNNSPVARAIAKVYFVECDGQEVPGTENASEASVGCRVHLDVTPKDSSGKPTRTKSDPRWIYSDPSLFQVQGNSPFNPVLLVVRQGSVSITCDVDGVRSNTFGIRFR